MIIIPGIFLGLSWFIEAVGYYLRVIGANEGKASMGYTRHVQLATLMRAGSFVALPLIAYNVDLGQSVFMLRIIPVVTFGIIGLGLSISLLNINRIYKILVCINALLSRISGMSQENEKTTSKKFQNLALKHVEVKVTVLSTLTFIIMSNAFFVTMIFASKFPEFRASIFQFTPFISFVGTIIATFYLDTRVSLSIDSASGIEVVNSILLGRLIGSLIGLGAYLIF